MHDGILSSPLTITYEASGITDADGIVESLATDTSPVLLEDAALDGAVQAGGGPRCRTITATSSAQAATYNTTDPIVITGTNRFGRVITAELQPTDADGGQTLETDVGFWSVTSIAIPAQLTTNGAWTFGVKDALFDRQVFAAGHAKFKEGHAARAVRGGAAGNIIWQNQRGQEDTLPTAAAERHPILAYRILGTSTANPVTAFL